jgi:putative transposase
LTIPGFPHHVIQRGNDRRAVFVDDADRERYLATLRDISASVGLAVHAYVLMPNHVHLLVTPQSAGDVGRVVQSLGRRYVRWFNDRHGRTGALFEGRYRSTVVEADRYLLACMRYVEMNPVRAGLVQEPGEFRWSSHAHHVGRAVDALINDHPVYWALGNTPFERQAAYGQLFDHGPSDEELANIRRSTHGGWLLGSAEAVVRLTPPSRRPVARKAGRPRRPERTLSPIK